VFTALCSDAISPHYVRNQSRIGCPSYVVAECRLLSVSLAVGQAVMGGW
jgi:hypothetical protein